MANYPFSQARWLASTNGRAIDLIVLHSMEAPEKGDTAEAVARYFANLPASRKSSCHFCVDVNSIVQCVRVQDVAYHAPGANHNGIGIEHAGYAGQSVTEWHDNYSRQMLVRSAALVAELCRQHKIPVQFVDAAGLRAGRRGITTHAQVSNAFRKSTHWDPGRNFPMQAFLALVNSILIGIPGIPGIPIPMKEGMITMTPSGGYWLCAADGGVFAFGDAQFYGSQASKLPPGEQIVAFKATSSHRGYYLVSNLGGVFAFGDAAFKGSMGGTKLAKPIVAADVTADVTG